MTLTEFRHDSCTPSCTGIADRRAIEYICDGQIIELLRIVPPVANATKRRYGAARKLEAHRRPPTSSPKPPSSLPDQAVPRYS